MTTGSHTLSETQWLHALRNALNSTSIALLVVETALSDRDSVKASEFAAHAREACDRAVDLLMHKKLSSGV